ncbi:MAG: helix-turn-helix transcriptional regulator, partial [Coprobacillaceae bacterium]
MQESRLFKIIYYLLDKEVVTAPELAEKFEVSTRTIYRDIDVISSAGVPIYTTQGRNGGIRLLDNYVLDKSLLSKTEKDEILIGLQSLSAVQYLDTNDVLTKLGGFFKTNPNWIEVDFTRWGSLKETEKDTFNILKRSIIEKY